VPAVVYYIFMNANDGKSNRKRTKMTNRDPKTGRFISVKRAAAKKPAKKMTKKAAKKPAAKKTAKAK